MEEAEGGRKELPSRTQREQRTRERMNLTRHPQLLLPAHAPSSPVFSSDEDEINVVDLTPPGNTASHAYTLGAHAFPMEEEVCEGPLDMSTKRREPPPYSVATALLTHQRAHAHATAMSEARRHVMQAGPVDPEIDEHFRRSLGQDYHHLFASPTPPTDPLHGLS
ncbi:hypothetical protein O3P69_019360 [Scylla paramamosain]|uniref:Uncharacterized protein n=1 Tax=Scylla paramamosain TaxID=85552 RepID=A0AAW0SVF1_SCYPA